MVKSRSPVKKKNRSKISKKKADDAPSANDVLPVGKLSNVSLRTESVPIAKYDQMNAARKNSVPQFSRSCTSDDK